MGIERGDIEEAFKKCAVVGEDNYTTPAIEHGFMEPEFGMAFPTADGGVEIRIGSQCVFETVSSFQKFWLCLRKRSA